MKITNNTIIKKILISIILVVMLGNLVMPNYSHALDGGDLAEPIFSFITWLADEVMGFLQINLAKGGDIKDINGKYAINYSLGNIFSNKIALFDINFVNPNEYETIIQDGWKQIHTVRRFAAFGEYAISKAVWSPLYNDYGFNEVYNSTDGITYSYIYYNNKGKESQNLGDVNGIGNDAHIRRTWQWKYNNVDYLYVEEEDTAGYDDLKGRLYRQATVSELEVKSIASDLQPTISTWYKGMRTLALVGLLSVLVYIGIRIIISSSSEDKAKYKKMLTGWIAAICIVFILHYVMVFITGIAEQLIEIFKNNVSGDIGQDKIITNIRNQIGNSSGDGLLDVAAPVICYVALIILTCIFTIQYLKRVIYMAFLTMIAPLIALTYPLDKIKDGKAQAFSMWLKEYIFNSLLQPIHLLLYVILIGSAENFVNSNPLYAIVAIAFLVPAEKFFRKMFGMESQTPVGTLGAAAGGAMVMSMLNKMKGKPPKEEVEEGKGRTSKSKNSKFKFINTN